MKNKSQVDTLMEEWKNVMTTIRKPSDKVTGDENYGETKLKGTGTKYTFRNTLN